MRRPSAQALLVAWERGRSRHPIDRALLLRALAAPEAEPDGLADEPLGRRNAALLRLRLDTFGSALGAYLDCPRCGARLEIELDASALLATPSGSAKPVDVAGMVFRPPTSRDLAAILGEDVRRRAALRLLRLCLVESDEATDDAVLEPILERVEAALEQADPWADFRLDLGCEACGHSWAAPFDIAGFLWEEIDAYAGRLLDEVHLLARAYGWDEAAILGLPESRRAAYIERVTA
jgi:hypothetical protein